MNQDRGRTSRISKLSGSLFARTLVFSWWQDPAASCDSRAALATLLGCPITAQGVDQRFSATSAAFLQALLGVAVQQAVSADPVAVPVLARFAHVEICDGAVITLPAALATLWAGCGHTTSAITAALKFVVRFDLTCGRLYGPHLAPARRHDQTVAAELPNLPPDSLFIGDLGFFCLAPEIHSYRQGAGNELQYAPKEAHFPSAGMEVRGCGRTSGRIPSRPFWASLTT